jgi:hypothetical protein
MRPAVSSWAGFLKTLPNVRLSVGCVALRHACSSATRARISSAGRRSRLNSPRATTSPGRSSERRYRRPSSAGVRQCAPVASATSARRSTAATSPPWAPAFIRTAPPTVPGIAHANSNPPRPAARARWRQTARAAPPPPRRTPSPVSARARSPRSRTTRPSKPWSATSRFEPRPTTPIASPVPAARARTSTSSSTVSGSANQRAGPPVPRVVKRASGRSS